MGSRHEGGGWSLALRLPVLIVYLRFPPDVSYRYAGTAGLRGKMGPGFNRMNRLVVQQTAQGLYR